MKKDYTHISFVLDASGSMGSILNDTIGGFNSFLESQKEAPGKATFSLTTFNTLVKLVYSFQPIKEVRALNNVSYIPGGGTALYDAIGSTIIGCGAKLAAMEESDRPEKVVIVILTDGEENSSREFSYEKIQDMIKLQSGTYNWEFIFLGANLDAKALGSSLGIKGGMSMTFAANSDGIGATFKSVSANLTSYRGMSAEAIAAPGYEFFKKEDEEAQTQAGA